MLKPFPNRQIAADFDTELARLQRRAERLAHESNHYPSVAAWFSVAAEIGDVRSSVRAMMSTEDRRETR